MQHRYKVGQMLDLRSSPRTSTRTAGPCEVIFCLPHDRGPVLYRVRSLGAAGERVVDEADLSPSDAVKTVFAEGKTPFNIAVVTARR